MVPEAVPARGLASGTLRRRRTQPDRATGASATVQARDGAMDAPAERRTLKIARAAAGPAIAGLLAAAVLGVLTWTRAPSPSGPILVATPIAAATPWAPPVDVEGRLRTLAERMDHGEWFAQLDGLDTLIYTENLSGHLKAVRGLRHRYEGLLRQALDVERDLTAPVGASGPDLALARPTSARLLLALRVRLRHLADRQSSGSRDAHRGTKVITGIPETQPAGETELAAVELALARIGVAARAPAGGRVFTPAFATLLGEAEQCAMADHMLILPPDLRRRVRAAEAKLEAQLVALPDPDSGLMVDALLGAWALPRGVQDPTLNARQVRAVAALKKLVGRGGPELARALDARRERTRQVLGDGK